MKIKEIFFKKNCVQFLTKTSNMAPGMIPAGSVNQITNNCDKFEEDAQNFEKEYTKIRQLGKGGYGEVFLYTRRIDGVKVAIKFVNKGKAEKVSLDKFLVFFICMVVHEILLNSKPSSFMNRNKINMRF